MDLGPIFAHLYWRRIEQERRKRLEEDRKRLEKYERLREEKRKLDEWYERQREKEKKQQIEALLQRDAVKDRVNSMSGQEFERFMAEVFRQKGYPVELTPGSGDQGVDLLATIEGRKVAIQLNSGTLV